MKLSKIWQPGKHSIILGAILGVFVITLLGVKTFGWLWGLLGIVPGAIIGAVCGVDSLIRHPYSMRDGPFTHGAIMTTLGLVCLGFGLYTWSSLVFICQRQENGQVDCRRTTYVLLNQHKMSEQVYEQVNTATQLQPDMVLISMRSGDQDFLDGFGPDTAGQIKRFLDSKEQTLFIEDNSNLWFFSPVFLIIGLGLLIKAGLSFRSGLKELSQ